MIIGRLTTGLLQKEFVKPENIDNKWKEYSRDPKKFTMPDGAIWHPKKPYNDYNAVWTDSDGRMITNFIVKEGSYFKKDKNRRPKVATYHEVLRAVVNDIRNGYAFDDNDRWEDSSNEFNNLDTCTHMLGKFSTDNMLVYSKCINFNPKNPVSDRLVYEVFKPTLVNGKYTSVVILNNFIGHKYNDKGYAGDLDKLFSNLNEEFYQLFF